MRYAAAVFMCLMWGPVAAFELQLPANARQTASRDSILDRVELPTAPFSDGGVATVLVDGQVTRRSFRVPSPSLTPLQLIAPLRAQLLDAGYAVLLDCDSVACGGFDFRFALDVLPAPNMYVSVRSYHFLSASHPDAGNAIWVLASSAPSAGYLQIVRVGSQAHQQIATSDQPASGYATPEPETELGKRLLSSGSIILRSINFAPGTTTLGDDPTPELDEIAQVLVDRPGLRIAVVGHTDSVGGLEANIAVSRARAGAVRDRLIERFDIAPERIEAGGMGYLSPVASNLSAEGREANRRVEVILVAEGG